MGATTQGRTRSTEGRGTHLVEREWELSALEQVLAEARAGAGGTVFIEGPAGSGKSALLAEAARLAARADMASARGRGMALEREFVFGLAIQLFEPLLLDCADNDRSALLAGAAQLAAPVLDGTRAGARAGDLGREPYAIIHGLFRVASNLIASPPQPHRGLLILADDAHLADALSLRFLAYLADRIGELPIALVVAAGAGERCTEPKAIARLRRAAGDALLRPRPLSRDGVAALLGTAFPEVDESFSSASEELTGGNPFLLSKLIEALRADDLAPNADSLRQLTQNLPMAIVTGVSSRLDDLNVDVRRVATSVAAFPAGASIIDVSWHCGLGPESVARAADDLSAAEMLCRGVPLRFAHPLVRLAVTASLSPLARADADRRAQEIGRRQREDADRIAARVLRAAAEQDTNAVGDQPAEPRSEISERTSQARDRAERALEKGRYLYASGRYREAAAVLDAGLHDTGTIDEQLRQQLLAAYVSSASLVEELQRQALERRGQMLRDLSGPPGPDQRSAIAHTAVHDALLGTSRAEVRLMVDLAWGNGALLHADSPEALSWPLLLAALIFTDELERELELCDTVLATARRGESPLAVATVEACRAAGLYGQGRVAEAQAVAESALRTRTQAGSAHAPIALSVIACCDLERARTEQADTVLSMLERQAPRESIHHPALLELRARLRLAQHRPREALEDALLAGQKLRAALGKATPGAIPWRSTAAFAHLRLGEPRQARKLAEEELHDARRIGVTSTAIRNLRVLGLAAGGSKGLELLSQAVEMGDGHSPRIEHMRALIDLGAALRRANRRSDARAPLRRGLEISHKNGAEVLAGRAHVELVASGARPRRAAFTGVEALTPSQRRVAGLAAEGLTTRQIAETLFVTPKTVEFHLRAVYQKLDVSSRSELTTALAAG